MENALKLFLKSRSSMIWSSTLEEDRTALCIQATAEELGYAVFEWSCTGGFLQLSQGNLRQPGDGQCTNIEQALRAVGDYKHQKAVFIFRDFQLMTDRMERSLDYVILARGLKRLYRTLKANGNIIVFMASSPTIPPELNDCLTLLESSLPNMDERLAIIEAWIKANCRDIPCKLVDEAIHRLVSASSGMTSRQIQSALAKSAVKRKGLGPHSVDDILEEKISVVRTSDLLDFIRLDATIDDVGGLEGIKDFLRKRSLAFGPAAARYGLPKPKGVILIGPPGTGKSLMAKVAANVLQLPLLRFDIGRMQGSLVGESEKKLQRGLALVESQAPCVMWIDELEKAFAGVSGPSTDSGVSQRQFGYFLNWTQERTTPVFMVATANNIRRLPPEFLRKGRFDEIFFVDLPNAAERKEIMDVLLRKRNINSKALITESLINKLDRYSGAELEFVINEAMFEAFSDNQRPIAAKDLEEATSRILPLADQMRSQIDELRRWGKANARPASNNHNI